MQVFDIIQDELWEYDAWSIVNIISYWFKEHTRYWFDTQADTELSPYKSDIYDYTSKLLEYGNNNQDWKHMMICNQSAVLTKILLESQWIPCRIISGMASEWSTLSWIWHAWNEYRNTQKWEWVSIDNTPTQKPSKELAPEMYDIVADLWTISSSLEKKAHRELISSALRSWILDIKDSMYTNQDIYDIIAIISKIPSNTIHTVKVSSLNITELPWSLSKLHALKSIDISDSTIMLSKRLINSLLQIPKLENIYMRKAQKIQYNDFIPPSLDRKISIPIIVTPWE
jgi:hypothetical protein